MKAEEKVRTVGSAWELGKTEGGEEEEVKKRAPSRNASCTKLNFEQALPSFIPSGSMVACWRKCEVR